MSDQPDFVAGTGGVGDTGVSNGNPGVYTEQMAELAYDYRKPSQRKSGLNQAIDGLIDPVFGKRDDVNATHATLNHMLGGYHNNFLREMKGAAHDVMAIKPINKTVTGAFEIVTEWLQPAAPELFKFIKEMFEDPNKNQGPVNSYEVFQRQMMSAVKKAFEKNGQKMNPKQMAAAAHSLEQAAANIIPILEGYAQDAGVSSARNVNTIVNTHIGMMADALSKGKANNHGLISVQGNKIDPGNFVSWGKLSDAVNPDMKVTKEKSWVEKVSQNGGKAMDKLNPFSSNDKPKEVMGKHTGQLIDQRTKQQLLGKNGPSPN